MKRPWHTTVVGMYVIAAALPAAAMSRAVGMAAVKDQLNDPSSAIFRNVRYFEVAICGEVNSKNASGAYTGYTRFIVNGASSAPMVWLQSQTSFPFRLNWNKVCHAAK